MRELTIDAHALFQALTRRDAAVLASVLDTRTGAVFQLADPLVTGQDNEAIEDAMDQEPERYAQVPVFDREYRLMCAWAEQVDDDVGVELISALRGESAFRAFAQVLEAHPEVAASWRSTRRAALMSWAEAWLRSMQITPRWHDLPDPVAPRSGGGERAASPVSPPGARSTEPLILHLMVLGGGGDPDPDGRIRRTVVTRGAREARRGFVQLARELCELRGEPWSSRYVRNADSFERGGVRLRLDAERIHLTMAMDPELLATWTPG